MDGPKCTAPRLLDAKHRLGRKLNRQGGRRRRKLMAVRWQYTEYFWERSITIESNWQETSCITLCWPLRATELERLDAVRIEFSRDVRIDFVARTSGGEFSLGLHSFGGKSWLLPYCIDALAGWIIGGAEEIFEFDASAKDWHFS